MEHVRRMRVLAALTAGLAIGTVGLTRPAMLRAGDPPWDPPPCPPGGVAAPGSGAAWFALDADLDQTGSLAGQQLTLGDLATGATRRMDLPPESFASGPVSGRVLVGDDDGTVSRLRVVDVAAGCSTEIGREASVVRGAVLSPDGRFAWEHRVSRDTRADEGIWRRPVEGGAATRVLAGLPRDARMGPTFATELAFTDDARLSVASCGERRCRVRVLEPRTGHVDRVDDTGPLLGVIGDRLVAYDACTGFPCPIDGIDLVTGRRARLVDAAGPAALGGAGGRQLVLETAPGSLAVLDLDTSRRRNVQGTGRGLPVRRGSGAMSGADIPAGDVLLAPGGHVTNPASARRLDVATGGVDQLRETRP